MNASDLLNVNPLIVDRVRLTIMAKLALESKPVDFNTLLLDLDLTKGNLSTHLRKLEDAGLVAVNKEFIDRKPRSTYQCTAQGKQEMHAYLSAMESLLKKVQSS